MKKIIYNCRTTEKRAAIIENDKLVELLIESPGHHDSIVQNIYKGRVEKVLPGMRAAFVDIGQGKNGFLQIDQLAAYKTMEASLKAKTSISQLLHEGQEIIAQVTKDAFGEKGPRLTTLLELSGQFIVYMPNQPQIAVSKKFNEEEREKWREVGKAICEDGEGVIFRTACANVNREVVQNEIEFLRRKWGECLQRLSKPKTPHLIYKHSGIEARVMQEMLGGGSTEVIVDEGAAYRKLKEQLRIYEHISSEISQYTGTENVFAYYGVDQQLDKLLGPFVELENGASLVIQYTEALTIIDVNTGKFTGKYDAKQTILKTNELAALEIARQLRLRDIGGMILIDFINMDKEEDKEKIKHTLIEALKEDRSYSKVLDFTKLGLLEMTRKKERRALHEQLMSSCPICNGTGRVLSTEETVFRLERVLWEYKGMDHEAVWVEVAPVVLELMKENNKMEMLQEALRFRIFMTRNEKLLDSFAIRHIGSINEIEERMHR